MIPYLHYLALKGFSAFINLLPESSGLWFGRWLGRAAYYLDREHRRVALQNLDLAFGQEKTKEELRRIAKGTFQHLGMTAVEFLRIPQMDLETLRQ